MWILILSCIVSQSAIATLSSSEPVEYYENKKACTHAIDLKKGALVGSVCHYECQHHPLLME